MPLFELKSVISHRLRRDTDDLVAFIVDKCPKGVLFFLIGRPDQEKALVKTLRTLRLCGEAKYK